MKKKIVMYVYGDLSTDARVQRAASALCDNYNVTVVSNTPRREVKSGLWTNYYVSTNHSGIKGVYSSLKEAMGVVKKEKPDIIYCHDYFSAILAFWAIKCYRKSKVVYDAHELIIPEKGVKNRRLSFYGWFEKKIVNKVDLLICAKEERGQLMREYYKLKTIPFVVPNVSQLEISTSKEVAKIVEGLQQFFQISKPTIVYAGVVSKGRGLNSLVDAALELAPKYKLLVIGAGDALSGLKERVTSNNEIETAFTGAVPYHALGALLSKCDVGYVYYPNTTLNNKYCASNKVYEYSSVLLPMVSNENITLKKQLEENGIGISSGNLAKAINDIMEHLQEYKENCSVFNKNNEWESFAKLLNNEIYKIL